jgi:hypothetical protein
MSYIAEPKFSFSMPLFIKTSLIILLLCTANYTRAQKDISQDATFLIPHAGLIVQFPSPPEVDTESDISPYFAATRQYYSYGRLSADSTFLWHVGTYWRHQNTSEDSLLRAGIEMTVQMFNKSGAQILLNEPYQYLGLPAHRIKAYKQEDKSTGQKPFYCECILFSRSGYFVEIAITNESYQNHQWKESSFFSNATLSDVCEPAATNPTLQSRSNTLCENKICFSKYGLSLIYPSGALWKRTSEESTYKIHKCHLILSEKAAIPIFGIDLCESKYPIKNDMRELLNTTMLLSKKSNFGNTETEKIISQTAIKYKGLDAWELIIDRDTRPGMMRYPGKLRMRCISFIHHNNLVMIFTYSWPETNLKDSDCFFEGIELK